jgi:hypothetical protein
LEEVPCVTGVDQDGNAFGSRNCGLEQLQPLARRVLREISQTGYVATGVRETGDKPSADGICDVHHDDRDRQGRVFRGLYRRRPPGDNDFRAELYQLGSEIRKALQIPLRRTDFDKLITVAERAQTVLEQLGLGARDAPRRKYSDPAALGRLCEARLRPEDSGATDQDKDIAPPHRFPLARFTGRRSIPD